MANGEYWKKRFARMEEEQHRKDEAFIKELEKQFRLAKSRIQADIEKWYYRLAENNDITYTAAKKLLKADELEEFRWTVEEYIEKGIENGVSQKWMKELENASAKMHINRLQAISLQIEQEAELLYQKYHIGTENHLGKVYSGRFCHTAYEIARGTGVGHNLAQVDKRRIEVVLDKSWAKDGANYSDRIWKNKEKLVNILHTELVQHIIRGTDTYKAAQEVCKKMDVSIKRASTLVYTESAAIAAAAQKDCFEELNIEEFEIVATLDSITSEICRNMDGKHFPMKDYEVGVTANPFHPNCRSVTCPYFRDGFTEGEKRIARGEDGKTYYVPADMTYKEWQKKFVDKNERTGLKNTELGDTISQSSAETGNMMTKINPIGKMDTSILEKEFGRIQTDEVIVTSERINHIKERHPEDYDLFEKYAAATVENPDYVIKDSKNMGTVFLIKKLPDTNLNIVSRLALDTDKKGLKNSVMTFYRIREKNLKKLLDKSILLYKKA